MQRIRLTRPIVTAALIATAAGIACRDITRPFGSAATARTSYGTIPAGTVTVSPGAMNGWAFTDDRVDTLCTDAQTCALVDGPAAAAFGSGSAELATSTAQDARALRLIDYAGLRLDRITTLGYATYRQSADAGNNIAIALQFNADYDLTDASAGYQGRLVFEPYQGTGGNVPGTTWQHWDAKAGRWWGTRASVSRGGVATTNPCVQATPCTWAQLLATFPAVGVHATYGAVYLKAGSSWPGFRGNVDSLAIGVDSVTTTFDFERTARTASAVPSLAPNFMPATMNDPAQWITAGENGSITLHRGLVIVRFLTTATQVQRQAAIDSVGGTVVGGRTSSGGPDGFYYVAIPGNGTPTAVYAAADKLSGLPQVRVALPHYVSTSDDLAYLRPRDGGDWARWKLDPNQAGSEKNWSSELLNLPYAWGCSVGDTATHVAVIDAGFHSVVDDSANVRSATRLNVQPTVASNVATWHGDAVTEILAATGNDSIGMTGTAWRASVHQLDAGDVDSTTGTYKTINGLTAISANAVIAYVDSAVTRHHARVINISSGSKYLPGHRLTDEEQRRENEIARMLYTQLRDLDTLSHSDHSMKTPLLVIAAGNSGQRTTSSGWAQNGAGDLADRVIVVTASRHTTAASSSLPAFANYGNEVTVAAPGEGVWARTDGHAERSIDGTSFAAPAVAGIATLLFSFDSSLTAQEARRLIIDAATASGRRVQDREGFLYPVADAYTALRFAAQRSGAPLCGNRVWKVGDVVYAERDSGNAGIVGTAAIATLPHQDWQSSFISVYHGGRRFDMDWGRQFQWSPGSRSFEEQTSYTNRPYGENGGTFLSYDGENHDNTRFFKAIVKSKDDSGFVVQVQMLRTQHDSTRSDTIQLGLSPRFPRGVPTTVCARRDRTTLSCAAQMEAGDWDDLENMSPGGFTRLLGAADAADSTSMYVVVNMMHHHVELPTSADWRPCGDDPSYECANVAVPNPSSASTAVYHVSFATNTWTPVTLPSTGQGARTIEWLAVAETGKEMVYGIGHTGDQYLSTSCTDQSLDFFSLEAATAGQMLRHVTLPDGTVCSGEYEAGGSIAPSRTPLGAPRLTAAGTPRTQRRTGRGPLKR